MKKVNILIAAAGLFITGILVFLMIKGTHLRERKMVKWSEVVSAGEAGEKIGRFFFPISKQYSTITIDGAGDFSLEFFKAFEGTIKGNFKEAEVFFNQESKNSFHMQIYDIETISLDQCKAGDRIHCVGIRARKKFEKKQRDPSKTWMNIYRLNESKAVLFFKASN